MLHNERVTCMAKYRWIFLIHVTARFNPQLPSYFTINVRIRQLVRQLVYRQILSPYARRCFTAVLSQCKLIDQDKTAYVGNMDILPINRDSHARKAAPQWAHILRTASLLGLHVAGTAMQDELQLHELRHCCWGLIAHALESSSSLNSTAAQTA